jgi:predicted small secreted protein
MMKTIMLILVLAVGLVVLASCGPATKTQGGDVAGEMTGAMLGELIAKIDKDAAVDGNSVSFHVKEREVYLIFDPKADRMRIITPIASAGVADEIYKRILQANYDAALDARYAIANDVIWAVFIHPLGSLTEEDFLSGTVQVVTAAETFGSSYTSGALVFGGGDSNNLHEELLKELEEAIQTKDKDI